MEYLLGSDQVVIEYGGLYLFRSFFSSRRRHTRSKRDWSPDVCSSDLFLLLVLLSGVVFGGWLAVSARNYPIAFICGPVVIWTAFRFTQRETAAGIFILSAIAVWGTL